MPSKWNSAPEQWQTNKDFARANRQRMPRPEVIIWQHLRGEQMNGMKFRRQHSIGPYIVDFYCHELKLAIELDGWSHDETMKGWLKTNPLINF
jgi:very-short-patch-repair endonuclease